MPTAILHDGAAIEFEAHGDGPAVLLPVNPAPAADDERAATMRAWGADPDLGHRLATGLAADFRVVAFDYEGHVLAAPKPATLTPDNVAADFLAVADAAGADRFAWYGYSWLAMLGLQLAIRTRRLTALVMGGYPPLDGPYEAMLTVTAATHRQAVQARDAPPAPAGEAVPGDWESAQVTMAPEQAAQFLTLYQALRGFDDREAQQEVSCPRLCFAGSADVIRYGASGDGATVDIAGPLLRRRADIEESGWDVHVLDGLDHLGAMQACQVLPIIHPWLRARLAG
ncbi:hypothetical protein Sru01_09050 [Sphaerisporangium rufum]|uniref:Alpha/beta hydrolase n=1 Tax=Sphaerisporangium rufum TaxID=1381558 RepID=A0A919QZ04_9ACTN|nr:alpha/beta hydrolase [Sphaerisporangium rufum]GII75923.1 hypothetical protein Sru01_09050 [Sphaerisporangium rufum]